MSRKVEGIVFPQDDAGGRSSTYGQKVVWADVFDAIGSDLAEKVRNEKKWRFKYAHYVEQHVRLSLESRENALAMAEAGLRSLHENFEFVRDGKTTTLADAMRTVKGTFHTGKIVGARHGAGAGGIHVPYHDRTLRDEALLKQLRRWEEYGTIEPSAAKAIADVVNNPEWTDLSDKYFVLLGAGSAMGPFLVLMALGANVIAVDLDRAGIWKRLIGVARESAGTLIFPLSKPQKELRTDDALCGAAGSNLITQAPEINNWLRSVEPEQSLVMGCYVYLDGEAHVRVVLACDAIISGVCAKRKDTAVAFLCTPTDLHVIPEEAQRAAKENYAAWSAINLVTLPVRLLSSKMLVRNVTAPVVSKSGDKHYYVDGLVVAQGPNYCLAKRMQHWRAIVAHQAGHTVSSNIAPSTSTASVVHNRQFAWAYDGMPAFKPMEIMGQETSNAVMSALLIHDLRNPKSRANGKVAATLPNPYDLFAEGSFHGGVWRCAYKIGSIGEVSVLIHFAKVLLPWLFVAAVAGLGYVALYGSR